MPNRTKIASRYFLCGILQLVFWSTLVHGQVTVSVRQDIAPDNTTVFSTIAAALAAFPNVIEVFPGEYKENLTISSEVYLKSTEGPLFTCINGDVNSNTILISESVSQPIIEGLSITGGKNGIQMNSSSSAIIRNCVIHANMNDGIRTLYKPATSPTTVEITNNVIQSQLQGSAIHIIGADLASSNDIELPFATILNNVLTANNNNALDLSEISAADLITDPWTGSSTIVTETERLIVDYNFVGGNSGGSWGDRIGTDSSVFTIDVEVGTNNIISGNAQFTGQAGSCAPDVRLLSTSPLKNVGNPDVVYQDPDGTTNDIGAYGGPGAENFFESPVDGPIVRDVATLPVVVQQGDTFEIRAIVGAR